MTAQIARFEVEDWVQIHAPRKSKKQFKIGSVFQVKKTEQKGEEQYLTLSDGSQTIHLWGDEVAPSSEPLISIQSTPQQSIKISSFDPAWDDPNSVVNRSILFQDPPRQEEENGQLTLWWNSGEPPDPDDFGGDTPDYREAWKQWEKAYPELAIAIKERNKEPKAPIPAGFKSFEAFKDAWDKWGEKLDERNTTTAKEIWTQTHTEHLDDYLRDLPNVPCREEDGEAIAHKYYAAAEWIFATHTPATEVEVLTEDTPTPPQLEAKEPQILGIEPTTSSQAGSTKKICITDTDSWIPTWKVEIDSGVQTRETENRESISLIEEKMLTGEWDWNHVPLPVVVFDETKNCYYVVSGNLRFRALINIQNREDATEGQKTQKVRCKVIPGTLEDAKKIAIRFNANQEHGDKETPQDFRNRIRKCLTMFIEWDIETIINELRTIPLGEDCSERTINDTIARLRANPDQIIQSLSSRLIAAYVGRPKAKMSVSRVMKEFLPVEPEPQPEPETKTFSVGSSTTPKSSGHTLVKRETTEKAKQLGLPTSQKQVLPDTRDSDRDRNASPYDVDDRPFANPTPSPIQFNNECLIGFVSNIESMNEGHIKKALEAIRSWFLGRNQDEFAEALVMVSQQLDP